jgi:RNA polymerase sigma-70 factor (ECF subfamily)
VTPETIQGLYERYAYVLFRRCRQLLGEDDEARDVVQEVFLQVTEGKAFFEGRSSPATFLFGVATNLCLNRLRHRTVRDEIWEESVARSVAGANAPPNQAVEARELARAILADADEETAAIALYHFVDGLSQGEIAKLVGKSRATVNQRIQRFRRQALERLGRT